MVSSSNRQPIIIKGRGARIAGAVAGGMIGWAAGPGGAGSGAVLGGFGGAMAYVAYEAYQSF